MHVESDVYRNRTISIHVEAAVWISARSRSLATTKPSFLSPGEIARAVDCKIKRIHIVKFGSG
jgi:hypothetical protein